ncbi:Carboxymuconolactone decarboxylase family protein [Pseudonocardia thermophila]|uniref:Carboxymuconolactone decarboxylase family protein n=1 Tax=Pseudonocardia thermophila TaxID=1848 RepID=A0A1M7B0F7_PSETH|nr:carboxymuconolactone decarboxylase family protein [Pseudonocardia thermophila]SHL48451.1 Carboxymuconolactone decarboxylase family protein [Pseudonocardia thermophila]
MSSSEAGSAPRIALPGGHSRPDWGTPLDDLLADYARAAVRARTVDPYITEIVRLRCAQTHDCRRCAALRATDAVAAGVDEAVVDKIRRWQQSDLPPAAKAALRLADAMILYPGDAGPDLREELRRHFTEEQIAEICLDVVKWSRQKVYVAFRTEAPTWDGLAGVSFDADGNAHPGAPLQTAAATS